MQTKYLVVRHQNSETPTLEFKSESLMDASKYFMAMVKNCRNNFDTLELLQIDMIPFFYRVSQLIYVGKNLDAETSKSSIKGAWHT